MPTKPNHKSAKELLEEINTSPQNFTQERLSQIKESIKKESRGNLDFASDTVKTLYKTVEEEQKKRSEPQQGDKRSSASVSSDDEWVNVSLIKGGGLDGAIKVNDGQRIDLYRKEELNQVDQRSACARFKENGFKGLFNKTESVDMSQAKTSSATPKGKTSSASQQRS